MICLFSEREMAVLYPGLFRVRGRVLIHLIFGGIANVPDFNAMFCKVRLTRWVVEISTLLFEFQFSEYFPTVKEPAVTSL